MRLRMLLPIALVTLTALVAPSCGSDDSSDTAATTSNDRDSSSQTSGSDKSSTSDPSSSDSGSDNSNSDIPDIGDITDGLPDNLEGCLNLASAYASLYLEALGGEDGAAKAQKTAEELKGQLPSELHDDIDVIADAIGQVATKGVINGSDALNSPEYNDADAALTKYFEQECGAG